MDRDYRFSICDYFQYVDGTANSRVAFEGEQVLNAGHIILCGITKQELHYVDIYALCLQTTSLQSPPHKIEGTFLIRDEDCQVKYFLCSCKAGKSGRCKHISAVLLLCTRTSLNKLEAISQTDIACAWSIKKNETKEKYQAIAIVQMECLKKNNCKSYNVSEATLHKIQTNFITALPSSALALHKTGRRQLQVPISTAVEDDVVIKHILNNACQSSLMMELMLLKVDFVAGCCEEVFENKFSGNARQILYDTKTSKRSWHSERQFRVTGSRIYEIFSYRGQNWSTKSSNYFYPKSFTNKYVKHGLQQEASARTLFVERTGLTVTECGFIISEFNPWLGYSPDGLVMDNNQYPVELIEIKCPFEGATDTVGNVLKKLPYLKFEDVYCLKEKHKYYGQVQIGMAILNLQNCKFIIYCSFDNSMAIIDVPYNYEFTKALVFNVKEKFFQHMLHIICNKK